MSRWTEEQKTAIEVRGTNLLVSAAAGSGKTAVLTERIIRLVVEDRIDIDRILVSTFTKAAAEEMKKRISKELTKVYDSGIDNKHIENQIKLLKRASISTMHSFCIDIIKENFFIINIDPNIKVGESLDLEILKKESMDILFDEFYDKKSELFINLIDMYSSNRNDKGLKEKLEDIYSFIQSKPNPLKWLEERVNDFNGTKEEILESKWISSIQSRVNRDLQAAFEFLKSAEKLCVENDWLDGYYINVKSEQNRIAYLLELQKKGFDELYRELSLISFERLSSKNPNGIDKETKEMIKMYRDDAKEILALLKEEIVIKSFDAKILELNNYYLYAKELLLLIKRYIEIYNFKKELKGIIDFNDIEHYALKILGNVEVANRYKDKFDYIFIDEYQDSNSVQDSIINSIKKTDNLFFVGDVKQSIYRFRMAEPKLFINRYIDYSKKENGMKVDLNKNFRSGEEVLKAINFIFENIMKGGPGEVEYDDDSKLYPGKIITEECLGPKKHIDLILIDKMRKDKFQNFNEDKDEIELHEIEAELITKKIKGIVGNELRFDEEKNEWVKIEYKDIAILVRSIRGLGESIEKLCKRDNIPIYCESEGEYFKNIDVAVFMNLLKLLDNKKQDIPLISILRSGIGKVSDEELAEIRNFSDSMGEKGCFYIAVDKYRVNNEGIIKEKLDNFYTFLEIWREMSVYMNMDILLSNIMEMSGYFDYILTMENGTKRVENLRLLIKKAEEFRKSSMKGLFNFVKFVEKIQQDSGKVKEAKSEFNEENGNSIRMMTIHKSKGLEFPIVFVAGLGKKFNKTDFTGKMILHSELGICPDNIDLKTRQYYPTLAKIAAKNRIKYENVSEEMRILYVALTRAKEKLILSASVNNLEKKCLEWLKPLNEYTVINDERFIDWIGRVMIRDAENRTLREIVGKKPDGDLFFGNSKWNIDIIKSEEFDKTNIEIRESEGNEQNVIKTDKGKNKFFGKESIFEKINWRYEHASIQNVPSKISVTGIEKENSKAGIGPKDHEISKKPSFKKQVKKMSGAEKGEIVHLFMQNINLEGKIDKIKIEKEISRLLKEEYFSIEESKAIEIDKIVRFFMSEIGFRMLNAKNVFREIPFCFRQKISEVVENISDSAEEILVQGVIDCFFEEEKGFVLLDYKTDYITLENKEELIRKYSQQLKYYEKAIEKITGKPVMETYVYLFGIGEYVGII